MSSAKRVVGGGAARLALLRGAFGEAFTAPRAPRGGCADDVLDACACLWVASAPQLDQLLALPAGPAPRDARGLAMQIWRRRPAAVSPETLFEDALDWLRATYGERRHYVERDLVWTLQTRFLAQIHELGLPRQVRNDYAALHGPRRAFSADLAILVDGSPGLLVECKYEPSHRRIDIPRENLPVIAWADVVKDAARVQQFVDARRAPLACAVLIDEGGYFRARPALPGGRWVDWGAPDRAPALAVSVHLVRAAARWEVRRQPRKRPKELAVCRLAHRQSRLLVIVDPPLGPLPAALRSSVRSPGTAPGIAPQAGSTVDVCPFARRFRMDVRSGSRKGLVHQLAADRPDLSTQSGVVRWIVEKLALAKGRAQ